MRNGKFAAEQILQALRQQEGETMIGDRLRDPVTTRISFGSRRLHTLLRRVDALLAALGVPACTAVWVSDDDRAFAVRLARYCARNPVALERLTYDRAARAVTCRSDKAEGPTVGTETVDPMEFRAWLVVHIPDQGHVTTRCCGWYTNRPRGTRRQAAPAAADGPPKRQAPSDGGPPHALSSAPRQRGGGHAVTRASVPARSAIG